MAAQTIEKNNRVTNSILVLASIILDSFLLASELSK